MINICTVIFKNILRHIDQKKSSKITLPCPCCRDLSLPSDSWVRALDPLVMPKTTTLEMVSPFTTSSIQEHTSLGRSTRQQSSKKKQPSTKLVPPSPPPPPPPPLSATPQNFRKLDKNLEESGIMSGDMEVQLKEVESIKKCQNPKRK
ncbi:hypothetical protein M9H77_03097 [Catharanthus roseus]|uniref:Uncharacterized protein n=1 Tax=Catharanthus roseus TaxID=4058 RepID=A0ACC0CAQ4_CATRO|nr:hypothetical protein M9H77_03097 [Catharanthus roseus]